MVGRLQAKVAFITGGGSCFGGGSAQRFAVGGATGVV